MTTMRIARILPHTLTDGPGDRVSLYMQGCSIRCPGCQNASIWDHLGGEERNIRDLAYELLAYQRPITILGGEPFDQSSALFRLLAMLKIRNPSTHIIVYTGYTYEQLWAREDVMAHMAFAFIDVLVDGPYVRDQDDSFVQYRGSRNQRVIDVPATRASLNPFTGVYTIHTLDWDTPELVITNDGTILGAEGVIELVSDSNTAARRCGQLRG